MQTQQNFSIRGTDFQIIQDSLGTFHPRVIKPCNDDSFQDDNNKTIEYCIENKIDVEAKLNYRSAGKFSVDSNMSSKKSALKREQCSEIRPFGSIANTKLAPVSKPGKEN